MFSKLENKNFISDASKAYSWIAEKVKAQEFISKRIEAYMIYLVRDGRAVANSLLRKYPHWQVEKFSREWVEKTKRRNDYFEKFNPDKRIKVAYEKLATNPHQTIE